MIIKYNNACVYGRLLCLLYMGVRGLFLPPSGHIMKLQQCNQVYVSAKEKLKHNFRYL